MSRSLEYWTQLIESVGYRFELEQRARAARIAFESDAAGKPCGAWHALNATIEAPRHPCPCVPCSKARESAS